MNKGLEYPIRPTIKVDLLSKPNQLEKVIALYRKDAKTLGFLPIGAFEEHAKKRQILLAFEEGGSCVGYLLYRVAEDKDRASIVHLCVSASHRSKGIAHALVDKLKQDTQHLAGIGLYCRRDYEANNKWPRYGFVAKHSKLGRGQDQAELTYWWLDHNHQDLFSLADQTKEEDKLRVVIDSNILFDLHERNTPESHDSKALLEPWLQESIELCLTKEVYNDINQANDPATRQTSRAYVSKYRLLKTDTNTVKAIETELATLLPESFCQQNEPDLRHLAHTIADAQNFFVTRDNDLIEKAEPLYERYGLMVLHPATLINNLDTLQREQEYRPLRLGGTPHRDSLVKAEMLEALSESFRLPNEKQSDLEKTLNHFLAKPQEFECRISSSNDGWPFVLSVHTRRNSMVDVILLRLSRESLAPTVARHILSSLVEVAARKSDIAVCVSDSKLNTSLVGALREIGFGNSNGKWFKFIGNGLLSIADIRSSVERPCYAETSPELVRRALQVINEYSNCPETSSAAKLEHFFWPGKVLESPLPSYIVPIQPRWAQHFFDIELGSQMLFGLRTELHLGIEGVYYRSPHGPKITAPGRILWYVSQGQGKEGAMAIKACSRLEEVTVAKAKELFRRFRRLGVYQRKDVITAAGGAPDGEAMALRFTLTERFESPIQLNWLHSIGLKGNFQGPREISHDAFGKIYRKGFNLG